MNRKNGKFFRRQTNCCKQFGRQLRKAIKKNLEKILK